MGFDFTSDLDDIGLSNQIEELTIENEKSLIYKELEGTHYYDNLLLHNDRTISSKSVYEYNNTIESCQKAIVTNSMIGSNGRCRWMYYGKPIMTYIDGVKGLVKIERGDCAKMFYRLEILNNPDLISIDSKCRTASVKYNPNLISCSFHLSDDTANMKYCGIEVIGNSKLRKLDISCNSEISTLDLLLLSNIRKDTKIRFNSFFTNDILQIKDSNIGFIDGSLPAPRKLYIGRSKIEIQDFLWWIYHSSHIQIGLDSDGVFAFDNRIGGANTPLLFRALEEAINNNKNEEDFFFIPEMMFTGNLDTVNGYVFTGEYRVTNKMEKSFSTPYVKVKSYELLNSTPMLKVSQKRNQIEILV